ncbi:type II toxin-antitoxin system VapC family toxin [Phormidesmis priestleyi]
MNYLVDTNVLIRFVDRTQVLHSTVRSTIRNLEAEGHELQITPQNCIEFWNVATRPIANNGFGWTFSEADKSLRVIERVFVLLPDRPEVYEEWRRLVVKFKVSGVQVHDARLMAVMKVNIAVVPPQRFLGVADTGISLIQ